MNSYVAFFACILLMSAIAVPVAVNALTDPLLANPISVTTVSSTEQSTSTIQSTSTTIQKTSTTVFSTSTSSFTTVTTSSSIQGNLFWNPNSQKVADLVVKYGYNSEIQMLHDVNEPGCNDYVSGEPCDQTYWTTSDNIPTCWTLGDFGYPQQENNCIVKLVNLNAFGPAVNGERYEAFAGYPIITGNPGDHHTVLLPDGSSIICVADANGNYPNCQNQNYGITKDGLSYNVQSDAWAGNGAGTPNPSGSVDVVAPQAINAWLHGDLNLFNSLETALINKYTSTNYLNTGSTWQLGQTMFVMRVGGQDNTNAFTQMENCLWSLQDSNGYLPNQYSACGNPGNGHDPENMDAGLLPFAGSLIAVIKADFGKF